MPDSVHGFAFLTSNHNHRQAAVEIPAQGIDCFVVMLNIYAFVSKRTWGEYSQQSCSCPCHPLCLSKTQGPTVCPFDECRASRSNRVLGAVPSLLCKLLPPLCGWQLLLLTRYGLSCGHIVTLSVAALELTTTPDGAQIQGGSRSWLITSGRLCLPGLDRAR